MDLFLTRSGYNLHAEDQDTLNLDVEQLILDVVEHRMSFEDVVAWFKARVKPVQGLP